MHRHLNHDLPKTMSLTLLSYIKQRFLASEDMGNIFYLDSLIVEMGTLHPNCICSVIEVISLRFTALQSPLSRKPGITVLSQCTLVVHKEGHYAISFLDKPGWTYTPLHWDTQR